MAVGIAVAIVVATRLQVFRQATAERVRGFAAVGVYIELEGYFVTPWQFLVPGDVVVSADSPVFVQAAVFNCSVHFENGRLVVTMVLFFSLLSDIT